MARERDYEKMTVAEQVRAALGQSLAQAKGELTLRTTTIPAPAPALSRAKLLAIRKRLGMSQAVFAGYLNVPKKTLQSWEQGVRSPKAGEARLLQVFQAAPEELLALLHRADRRPARKAG